MKKKTVNVLDYVFSLSGLGLAMIAGSAAIRWFDIDSNFTGFGIDTSASFLLGALGMAVFAFTLPAPRRKNLASRLLKLNVFFIFVVMAIGCSSAIPVVNHAPKIENAQAAIKSIRDAKEQERVKAAVDPVFVALVTESAAHEDAEERAAENAEQAALYRRYRNFIIAAIAFFALYKFRHVIMKVAVKFLFPTAPVAS
jgi:hypothetical protein